jgi:TPP-dependent 2-oxoacid decarboxylase
MTSVADYLTKRLEHIGIQYVFGVAGDYVLDFMDRIVASPLKLIPTCNELDAGYAADGYARANGVSAVVVTYGVGGLSVFNAVAGAYAERVPMIVISGAPHSHMRHNHVLVHHLVRHYEAQLAAFREITSCAVILTDPATAPEEIDRAIGACIRTKRPVYIEIPVDVVDQGCRNPEPLAFDDGMISNADALDEAVREAAVMLATARSPAALIGMEVRRFGLGGLVADLLEKGGYPVATTIGGKSAIAETHPHFVGVYQGGFSLGAAHDIIEGADVLLCLGAWMTDITTGGFTAHLDEGRMVSANSDRIRIRHHIFEQVSLRDLIEKLTEKLPAVDGSAHVHTPVPYQKSSVYKPVSDRRLTVSRFFDRMNRFLDGSMVVVSDTGDVMFGATELHRDEPESYFAQDYYLSIGYGLPAALGVALAVPGKRTVVFTGDGAFQMTAQELSTFIRYGVNATVFVLNNGGYATERMIHDGPYNEVQPWRYCRLPEAFGGLPGLAVRTEGDLERALEEVRQRNGEAMLVEIIVERSDTTEALARVGESVRRLSKK